MKDELITIENDGEILQRTNYFDTPQAMRGEAYLTWNAGYGRLLVPDNRKTWLTEMRTAKKVEIEKIPGGMQIFFDDLTPMPFSVQIADQQTDRSLEKGKCKLSVYVRLGEKFQFDCEVI